jgi:hypothetical protein
MADPLQIKLNKLDPAAWLESAGGTVVTAGGQSRLDGAFALAIAGQRSGAVAFDASSSLAVVTGSGAGWQLSSLAKTGFAFNTPLVLADGSGPWLRSQSCWLIQPRQSGAMAILSLEDSRGSLIANGPDPGPRGLVYPTQNGNQIESLSTLPHPEDSSWLGAFVLPFEGGHVVHLGMLTQGITLDHAVSTDVIVQDDCGILFHIPVAAGTPTKLSIDSSTAQVGAIARAAATSNLMMAASPGDSQWSRLKLPTSRIEVSGPSLKVTRFRDREVLLGHVADSAQSFADSTWLFSPTNRLGFELELVPVNPAAKFVYTDASIASGTPSIASGTPSSDGRFYGLAVQGLGSRRGIRPLLDASELHFSLAENATQKFHVKAGLASMPGSVLVPKPDPRSASGARVLDVPVSNELSMRISASKATTATALQLDTELPSGHLTVQSPTLLSAPVGITARSPQPNADPAYLRWSLGLPADAPNMAFTLGPGSLQPVLDKLWLNQFHTIDPSVQYGLIEHPGTRLTIDGAAGPAPAAFVKEAFGKELAVKRTKTEITTHTTPDGKELAAYSAFFTVLSWAGARCISTGVAVCLDESQYKIQFPDLTDASMDAFVKQNGLQNLQVVYFTSNGDGSPSPEGSKAIQSFVDGNMIPKGGPPPPKYHWPFASGLSILLYDQSADGGPYCDGMAKARKAIFASKCYTRLAFDFSSQVALAPSDLGYSDAEWHQLAVDSPALWPRGNAKGGGARLDPTDKLWRGTFLRDLPLFLPAPPIVGTVFPFLQTLIDGINKKLMLDYGWRDESGATWFARLDQSFADGSFTPSGWQNVLEMSLTRVVVKGAAGAVVTAEGTCEIHLGLMKDKAGKPAVFQATFGMDLESGGPPITRIDVTQDGKAIETDDIPGFTSVALKRFTTDLKTNAQIELELVATDQLASALPFLSSGKPQKAILAFHLEGPPSPTLSLAIPSELQTNLFGRWPLAIEAMSIEFGSFTELRVRGRIHLGMAEFGSVGATVVVRKAGGSVTLDVMVDSIAGSLSVGKMKISGSLKWQDKGGASGPVPLTGVEEPGQNRDLWASLSVEDPGVLGSNTLAARIGNKGEVSFWIASLGLGVTDIPIGIGKLKKPALLLAHNADFDGNLGKTITDPTGSILKVLRPDFSKESSITEWLGKWQPSSKIGSIVAGSGYIDLQSSVAEAPSDKTGADIDPAQLSSLLFTDRGLFRIDGVMTMLGAVPLRFGLALDFENRRITAGLQAPTINMPPVNPQYQISAGYITIGISFSGADPWFRIGIGWPERVGGSEFERDWTKATKVYVESMEPINTFWGGYLAELDRGMVRFGFAIRAGWTWNKTVGIAGVASGSADLGITLGGVFQFALVWNGAAATPASLNLASITPAFLPAPRAIAGVQAMGMMAAHATTIAAAMESVDSSLTAMSGVDLAMSAEIFGDVWGSASVQFLGVTLVAVSIRAFARFRVCGTLRSGITQAKAEVGFEISVTILCFTYRASAQIDITLIDGPCMLVEATNRFLLAGAAPSLMALSAGNSVPAVQ